MRDDVPPRRLDVTKSPGSPTRSDSNRSELLQGRSLSFLLSQVGAHSSRLWNERLRAIGLDSRQVMLLWDVARAEGRSQRELAAALGLPESRVVGLVDALEGQGWLERKAKAGDRRARALHLTTAGRELLDRILTIAADQEEGLRAGLTREQRRTLIELLDAIAEGQGLVSGVHPDF